MALALRHASGFPCGNRDSALTLDATKSIADPFLHEATHAPHPMQEEASMLSSAFSLETSIVCASGALPVLTLTNPPACSILSKALRLTTRSLITGNAPLLKGSTVISLPSLKRLMYN